MVYSEHPKRQKFVIYNPKLDKEHPRPSRMVVLPSPQRRALLGPRFSEQHTCLQSVNMVVAKQQTLQ